MLLDGLVKRFTLALQKADDGLNAAAVGGTYRLLLAVVFSREHRRKLLAPAHQLLEPLIRRGRRDVGTGTHLGGEQRQAAGIEAVSLGQLTMGLGKMVGVTRVNPGGRNSRFQQGQPHFTLVTTGGLQYHQRWSFRLTKSATSLTDGGGRH